MSCFSCFSSNEKKVPKRHNNNNNNNNNNGKKIQQPPTQISPKKAAQPQQGKIIHTYIHTYMFHL